MKYYGPRNMKIAAIAQALDHKPEPQTPRKFIDTFGNRFSYKSSDIYIDVYVYISAIFRTLFSVILSIVCD